MNNFINSLVTTIVIVFLLVLTLFMFSLLVEYVRALWARHKFRKIMMKEPKEINIPEEDRKKLEKALNEILKKNGIDINKDENE